MLPADQTRRLLHHLGRWLDDLLPAHVRAASSGSLDLVLWRPGDRERRVVSFAVLTEVTTWQDAGEQLAWLLENEIPDAIEALTGDRFPAMPPSKRFPRGGPGAPFHRFADGTLRYGWRRADGWELSDDPFDPSSPSNSRANLIPPSRDRPHEVQ